jgi:hypothetical protein
MNRNRVKVVCYGVTQSIPQWNGSINPVLMRAIDAGSLAKRASHKVSALKQFHRTIKSMFELKRYPTRLTTV